MTVSLRAAPLAFLDGIERVEHHEFPFLGVQQDPNLGSQSLSAIAAEITSGTFALAWISYGGGAYPPSGFSQPSTAQLLAALRWWPLGFHHRGLTSWSPNFGYVTSSNHGLSPNGDVVPLNACYTRLPNYTPQWRFLGYSSVTNDSLNPYSGNANAFYRHLGYDLARRKDLCLFEDNYFFASEHLAIYEYSATIPTVRGTKVWQGTNGDRALSRHFKTEGGCQVVQIPWLGVWWVVHYSQTAQSADQIWGFAPTASPASSSSSTPAGFAVTVPSDVSTVAKAGGGNIHLCVDQMNRRVFACQADTTQTATVVGNINRYPLKVWEVNPSTFAWTAITLSSELRVSLPAKVNLQPLAYYGGSRFIYSDQREQGEGWGPTHTGHTISGQTIKDGNTLIREIFIPKASYTRTMTWTARTWTGAAASSPLWNNQKHVSLTFRPSNGKMYCFGGDHGWGDTADATLTDGSYNNQVLSFTPEAGNDLTLEAAACPASLATYHPIRVDENGFEYRQSSDDFWMMPGYGAGSWVNQCGWSTRADWEAAGGGYDGFFKWNLSTGWAHSGRTVGTVNMVPKSGFTGRTWIQGEDHCRRWYYDSGADKMVAAAFGSGGITPDLGLQTQTLLVMDCTTTGGNYEFAKYRADRCFNGAGGDVTKLPDGRPYYSTVDGANAMWKCDRMAIDTSTGHLYVYQPASGDVFRIHTRSDFWTYESFPAARVDWVCRVIPSGTRSWNLAHFIWAKNALWMFLQSGMGRIRVFSWASGEQSATEHPTPTGAVCTAVGKYTFAGDERIILIGSQTWSPDGGAWGTTYISNANVYYTITLS